MLYVGFRPLIRGSRPTCIYFRGINVCVMLLFVILHTLCFIIYSFADLIIGFTKIRLFGLSVCLGVQLHSLERLLELLLCVAMQTVNASHLASRPFCSQVSESDMACPIAKMEQDHNHLHPSLQQDVPSR